MPSRDFNQVEMHRPGRSVFDLSYAHLTTGDLGEIYPICADEAIPGDIWSIGNAIVIRFLPMVAPIMHRVNVFVHYFFVPYRLLDTGGFTWEDYITGGEDGTDAQTAPTWSPSDVAVGSLWDRFGFPATVTPDADNRPLAFPLYGYNMCYNEWFRDQELVTAVALTSETIQKRAWERDYFTSALPDQQKGTPPALPITLDASAAVSGSFAYSQPNTVMVDGTNDTLLTPSGTYNTDLENALEKITSTAFDISDLRLTAQIQQWMERNSRSGGRYIEYLQSMFGVSPLNLELQIPDLIGSTRAPLMVSEVLQTESSDATTPQGTYTGKGIAAGRGQLRPYRVREYGLVLGLLSVMPKPTYAQGSNRQWNRQSRYDHPNPMFAHLSEQGIEEKELYLQSTKANNETIFGYQGMYDECRTKQTIYSAQMGYGQSYDHFHIGRYFSGRPSLNQTFIECDPRKDYLASAAEPAMMINCGNILRVARPLPAIATPGITRI